VRCCSLGWRRSERPRTRRAKTRRWGPVQTRWPRHNAFFAVSRRPFILFVAAAEKTNLGTVSQGGDHRAVGPRCLRRRWCTRNTRALAEDWLLWTTAAAALCIPLGSKWLQASLGGWACVSLKRSWLAQRLRQIRGVQTQASSVFTQTASIPVREQRSPRITPPQFSVGVEDPR